MKREPRRKVKKLNHNSDFVTSMLLLIPYLLLFSLFIAIPVIIAIGLSFTYFDVINTPHFVGLSNYISLLTSDEIFLKYIIPNTFKYALIVGPGGCILSFILAWLVTQIQAVPRTILTLCLYMPSMVGPLMIQVVWKTVFNGDQRGILNAFLINHRWIDTPINWLLSPDYLMTIIILVALWQSMGVGFLSMIAGILNVNEELYEAAYVDGMKNRFQEVIYITIPSMKPQMLFGAVMAIVGAFNTGWIGPALSGTNPTPGYSGNLILNHIEDYAYSRYEMGYAAAVSVVLLLMIAFFSKVAGALFKEKD
ncbi:MAG: sugar ABC transporter permease [Acetatifactor sp.]|nr:sugar ABC transporter permease [Acetatifactor sp.]